MTDETPKPEDNQPEPFQPPASSEDNFPAAEPFTPPPPANDMFTPPPPANDVFTPPPPPVEPSFAPPPAEPSFAPPPPPPGPSFSAPPPQKPGMKWWVIALIVVAVLCCCCVVVGVLLYAFGDQIFGTNGLDEFNRLLLNLVV